jgi:hypothetical protein
MPEYQCLWFQFYRASNFYCMTIATESLSPTGPPLATDWVAASVAVAAETSVTTAITAIATDSIITAATDSIITAAADAAAVNTADAAVAAPLAVAAENNDDDAITMSKQASVIFSTMKISLGKRQRDSQPDKRHERGRWQQKQQQLQQCNNQQKEMGQRRAVKLK